MRFRKSALRGEPLPPSIDRACTDQGDQVDEVSDKQSGADARETGNTYLNAMRDTDWDNGSVISRMTKEYAIIYSHRLSIRLTDGKGSARA